MQIQLELGPEYKRTVAELSSMGAAIVAACARGLGKGVKIAAGNVASNYLSGQSLRRRKGDLARAIDGWLESDTEGIVGVKPDSGVEKYKWLLGDEEKLIVPVRASALTIPIGESLTGAGVAKWGSVREAAMSLGAKIFRLKGTNVLGYKVGKKGKFRALFALVKSVFVQGSGALYDGTMDKVDDITGSIQSEVDKEIGS